LYVALDRQRRRRRLSWRDVAREVGVSPSSLTRLSHDQAPSVDGLVRLMGWLCTTNLAPFIDREDAPR
jgi:transcriptional regulator with XRE-family HTH domain